MFSARKVSIYKEIIIDHYRNPRHYGHLKKPSKKITVANPLCGDQITMEIVFKKGLVKDIKFSGHGCAISTAAASMLTSYAKNKSKTKLINLDNNFIIKMLSVDLGPNRLKCALLPLRGLRALLAD